MDEQGPPLDAAKREFQEEIGLTIAGEFHPLAPVKQKSGKIVYAWAVESNCDAAAIRSSTFSMEWPPKSGRMQNFPEVDKAAWFSLDDARVKLNAS